MKNIYKVKDCSCVQKYGSTILLTGKKMWIFREDGTFVGSPAGVLYPNKVIFLPGNKLLADDVYHSRYHYISLDDGSVIWTSEKFDKRRMSACRFAVNSDGTVVYDAFYSSKKNNTLNVIRIVPETGIAEHMATTETLRTTFEIFCDPEDVPCAYQKEMTETKDPARKGKSDSRIALLRLHHAGCKLNPELFQEWIQPGYCNPQGGNWRYILYSDLTVKDWEKDKVIDLLENDSLHKGCNTRNDFLYHYDADSKYLFITFVSPDENIVVDCCEKRIIARYFRPKGTHSFRGCVINGEYWFATDTGIVKRPFPLIEEPEQ